MPQVQETHLLYALFSIAHRWLLDGYSMALRQMQWACIGALPSRYPIYPSKYKSWVPGANKYLLMLFEYQSGMSASVSFGQSIDARRRAADSIPPKETFRCPIPSVLSQFADGPGSPPWACRCALAPTRRPSWSLPP